MINTPSKDYEARFFKKKEQILKKEILSYPQQNTPLEKNEKLWQLYYLYKNRVTAIVKSNSSVNVIMESGFKN